MTKVAIVYHSGYGHTKLVAEAVRDGAAEVAGTQAVLMTAEEAEKDVTVLDDCDAIVFGAPTYMGSASAPMKAFMDATSKVWFEMRWKDKIAGGFTNSANLSGDKVSTLEQFAILAAQHGMIWVSTGFLPEMMLDDYEGEPDEALNRVGGFLGPMAISANAAPGPDNPPQADIRTAQRYGRRIAGAAKRWGPGKLDD